MIRGTTPTLYFKLNNISDTSNIQDVWVTFRTAPMNGKEPITITKKESDNGSSIHIDENNIIVTLSQEDTLKFKDKVQVQIKILFADGEVAASSIFTLTVNEVLNQAVMKTTVTEGE